MLADPKAFDWAMRIGNKPRRRSRALRALRALRPKAWLPALRASLRPRQGEGESFLAPKAFLPKKLLSGRSSNRFNQ